MLSGNGTRLPRDSRSCRCHRRRESEKTGLGVMGEETMDRRNVIVSPFPSSCPTGHPSSLMLGVQLFIHVFRYQTWLHAYQEDGFADGDCNIDYNGHECAETMKSRTRISSTITTSASKTRTPSTATVTHKRLSCDLWPLGLHVNKTRVRRALPPKLVYQRLQRLILT